MRAAVTALVLLLSLPLYACAQVIGSPFARPELTPAVGGPLIITAFRPPADYARWYANMESCLGMEGDFESVRWLVVPAPWRGSDAVEGLTHGFWLREGHQIIVNAQEWQDSALVEHEAVHDILSYNRDSLTAFQRTEQHPQPFFDGVCAPELYTPLADREGARYTSTEPNVGTSWGPKE
jgi:hypothetical protein